MCETCQIQAKVFGKSYMRDEKCLPKDVAIYAFFSGKIEDLENLAGVKDLTNSTSTAVAAAGQQTLLSHDLDRAGAAQPRCPGRIQPHMKRTISSTI